MVLKSNSKLIVDFVHNVTDMKIVIATWKTVRNLTMVLFGGVHIAVDRRISSMKISEFRENPFEINNLHMIKACTIQGGRKLPRVTNGRAVPGRQRKRRGSRHMSSPDHKRWGGREASAECSQMCLELL